MLPINSGIVLLIGAVVITLCHQQCCSPSAVLVVEAFTATPISTSITSIQQRQTQINPFTSTSTSTSASIISMVGDDFGFSGGNIDNIGEEDNTTNNDETNQIRVEPGTHDELMYSLGVNLARQLGDIRPLVESGEELAQVAKGLLDTVVGRLNDDGQRLLLSKRGKELDQLILSRSNALREKLEVRGREMLQNMVQTDGVLHLETGVAVHVLEQGPDGPGQGAYPTAGSVVVIHYHGTLSDGTVFDSTLGGEPVKFPLAQVIPGWRDGVLNMHQGETAMIGIPPEQAYGDEGTPDGRIPGGSTLFFKLQLVDILSGGVGGSPSLLGADGQELGGGSGYGNSGYGNSGGGGSGLIGADGQPM
mmetsp:Transcript_22777/g.25370  ORF Transcript_22777/g.25370 Transcript_22777/m.25370 type:complete len:362 (+) Transcript_22777:82-1167(+)